MRVPVVSGSVVGLGLGREVVGCPLSRVGTGSAPRRWGGAAGPGALVEVGGQVGQRVESGRGGDGPDAAGQLGGQARRRPHHQDRCRP